ncbi:HIRAN domain-containing protein [Vibrio neonatus]|uniref:HIRAN domain-containing protein n=1 Tax=Vibrio neonatus TaxID=278860 RepID=UPI0021C3B116|nr:HIRAN domain-containing protein [Vibrio neonatus]
MTTINNFIDINTLFLTWQSDNERNHRYFVGVINKITYDSYSFTYLVNTSDYDKAISLGFKGYPAFKLSNDIFTNEVLESFRKRLPPKSRRDFSKYLQQHNLPTDFSGDDFQLISHTGIQLPSDGFDLVPDLSEAEVPFDYVTELAGTRYYKTYDEVAEIDLGSNVTLIREDCNKKDPQAICVEYRGKKIGYINRLLCPTLRTLMIDKSITCAIVKKSGTEDRPLLYVLISAR